MSSKNVNKKENLTFRIDPGLRRFLKKVAQRERRSLSNQLNKALEEWVKMRDELHPQFIKDIKDSLKSGKPEPVWKG